MADDARSQFVDGLRVTADHLQHLQDRLRESVQDLRRGVGLGRVAWGLRASNEGLALHLDPGVAFAHSGVRLAVDAALSFDLGTVALPARLVARAGNSDKAALRVAGTPTLINLLTEVTLEADLPGDLGDDALLLAQISEVVDASASLTQPNTLFAASGQHAHSGKHFQDEQGRWHFDGAPLAGTQGDTGPAGPAGAAGPAGPVGDVGPAGPAGEVGQAGPAGAAGSAGPAGDVGGMGPAGADGPSGDPGPAGQAGPAGDVGPSGPAGPAGEVGATGPAGPAGESGPTGLAGDIGPAGPAGPTGDIGPAGPVGPAGEGGPAGPVGPVGAPGSVGAVGATGPDGAAGAPGPAGATGKAGAAGAAGPVGPGGAIGPAGPSGSAGPAGPSGAVGPAGATGPAGPAGPPAVLDWPFVAKVNWPHGQTIPLPAAVALLGNLRFDLSIAMAADVVKAQPAVVQVWFEPNGGGPAGIATVHGALKFAASSIIWQASDTAATITRSLVNGGRLLIRLHSGVLLDKDRRAFSAALDALIGAAQPHVPGGVFEGWVMVLAG